MEEENKTDEITPEIGKVKSKKKFIIVVIILIILIAASGGGIWFFMFKDKKHAPDNSKLSKENTIIEKKEKKSEDLFLNLEDIIVNLQNPDKQTSFLKMEVTLQVTNKQTLDTIQNKMPIILDSFQTYLRELRTDDLQGSAGIYRLREELLLRINKITFPDQVTDILFREFLVQ